MPKPNLFIVGAPKCGTTAWVRYLSSHPDVYFSPLKEPHYFCTDFPRWGRHDDEQWYLSFFKRSGNAKVIGEASVRYLHSREAAMNIRRFNPDARIIIFLRAQEDYLPSQHNQMVFNKDECFVDFETAWRLSKSRDSTNISPFCREPSFLDYASAGAFSKHVERYFDQFPEEQVRVFHFSDWSKDPRTTYLEILRFLRLKDDGRSEFPRINEARRRRTNWLWRLQREPALLKAASTIRKLTGLRRLFIGSLLKRLDTQKGSVTRASEALKSEIVCYYEADNLRVEARIWRPPSPSCSAAHQVTCGQVETPRVNSDG